MIGKHKETQDSLGCVNNYQRVRTVGVYEISVPKYVVAHHTLTLEYWEALKLYKYINLQCKTSVGKHCFVVLFGRRFTVQNNGGKNCFVVLCGGRFTVQNNGAKNCRSQTQKKH